MTQQASSTIHDSHSAWSLERRFVVAGAAATAAIVWTHAIAALLRRLTPADAPLASWPLTVAAIAVAIVAVAVLGTAGPKRTASLIAGGTGLAAAALLEILYPGAGVPALALALVGPAATAGGQLLGRRLPPGLGGTLRRRPLRALLWGLLAIVCVAQTARLATYMTDPTTDWYLTTRHPFWAKHECLPAYVYGAELNAQGAENVYDASHYPGLNPSAQPHTTIAGMAPEDPFQYPPQFLLLPRLAIFLTGDYPTLRVVWFALQATLFATVAAWLALWVGGREGRLAGFLLPLAWTAFPTLHALQYGQFHLAAVALGIGALLAFESRRRALGGAMLAVATLSKIFPGLLLVVLVVRRRWRDLAWSASFILAITMVAWAVLGTAPFAAFFHYHLPRLASGQAFAFGDAWPEVRELIIADNQGAYGLIVKLREMGLSALDTGVARLATKLFALAVLVLTGFFARREESSSHHQRAISWLAILGLGSLLSTGAFGDYVPLTATWLLTFVAARIGWGSASGASVGSWRLAVPLAACWLFQFTLLGTAPIGQWAPAEVMIPLSAVGVALLLGLYGWVLVGAESTAAVGVARAEVKPGMRRGAVPIRPLVDQA